MLGPQFSDALTYATNLHREHLRKGTTIPYISHLLGVASLVIEHCGDEDAAIAALLHDAAEDGKATLAEIRERYGPRVADIVDACTDTYEDPKPPWKERKQSYIDSMARKDRASLLVSLADKVHNARAILTDYRVHGEALWSRFNASRDDTLWYYKELRSRFKDRTPKALWSELDNTIKDLEALMKAKEDSAPPKGAP